VPGVPRSSGAPGLPPGILPGLPGRPGGWSGGGWPGGWRPWTGHRGGWPGGWVGGGAVAVAPELEVEELDELELEARPRRVELIVRAELAEMPDRHAFAILDRGEEGWLIRTAGRHALVAWDVLHGRRGWVHRADLRWLRRHA